MKTSQLIIEKYKELVRLEKRTDISVSEICRQCKISRKTFYNYFCDRYEIIENIMYDEIEQPLLKAIKADFSTADTMRMIFESFLYDKEFYKIAIRETGQNSLYENLIERIVAIYSENDKYEDRKKLSEKEYEYIAYRFSAEIVLMIKKWIMNGMVESPEFMSKVVRYPKLD